MKDSTLYIVVLIHQFPCLHSKLGQKWCPEQFDPDAFMAMTGKWSTREILCALFVVNVWNPGYAKRQKWNFNIFDFFGTADADNAVVVSNWTLNPYFP